MRIAATIAGADPAGVLTCAVNFASWGGSTLTIDGDPVAIDGDPVTIGAATGDLLAIAATTTAQTAPRIQRVEHRVTWFPEGSNSGQFLIPRADLGGNPKEGNRVLDLSWEMDLRSPSNTAEVEIEGALDPGAGKIDISTHIRGRRVTSWIATVNGLATEVSVRQEEVATSRWGVIHGNERYAAANMERVLEPSGKSISTIVGTLFDEASLKVNGVGLNVFLRGLSRRVRRRLEVGEDWVALVQRLARLEGRVIRSEARFPTPTSQTPWIISKPDSPSRLPGEPTSAILGTHNVLRQVDGSPVEIVFERTETFPPYEMEVSAAIPLECKPPRLISSSPIYIDCGTQRTVTERRAVGDLPAQIDTFFQDSAGNLTARSFFPALQGVDLWLETTEVFSEKGEVVRTVNSRSEYHRQRKARYRLKATGSFGDDFTTCYVDDDTDPRSEGFVAGTPQWLDTGDEVQSSYYDEDGYKVREVRHRRTLRFVELARWKRVNQTDSWEAADLPRSFAQSLADGTPIEDGSITDPVTGQVVTLGNGEGKELLLSDELDIETFDVGKGDPAVEGRIVASRKQTFRWGRRPGWRYKYLDGFESDDETEQWIAAPVVETSYLPISSEQHQETIREEGRPTIIETVAGALPSAAKRTGVEGQNQEVKRTARFGFGGRATRRRSETLDLADYPEQVALYAKDTGLLAWARTVSLPVDPEYAPEVGTKAWIDLPMVVDPETGRSLRRHGRVVRLNLERGARSYYLRVLVEYYPS